MAVQEQVQAQQGFPVLGDELLPFIAVHGVHRVIHDAVDERLALALDLFGVQVQRADHVVDRGVDVSAFVEDARAVVRAPLSGFVVLNEIFQGNQKRKPRAGDTVWQGQAPLYLPDLTSMIVKTQVREEDLQKIKKGLGATVRVDAYPDASFEGEVGTVGVLAIDTAGMTTRPCSARAVARSASYTTGKDMLRERSA